MNPSPPQADAPFPEHRSLAARLDRLAAADRELVELAAKDQRPEDLELARRSLAAQSAPTWTRWRRHLPALAAALLACLGLFFVLDWPPQRGSSPQPGTLGSSQVEGKLGLVAGLPVELPVSLRPGDLLTIVCLTLVDGGPGVTLPVEIPRLDTNRWTPTSEQLAGLPEEGVLELTLQRASGAIDAPVYSGFSLR